MRSLRSFGVFAWSFLFLAGVAAADEARALLDRAIEAHGGAARLERTKKGHLKARYETGPFPVDYPCEFEETFDLPGRYKLSSNSTVKGVPIHSEEAVSGTKGWFRKGTEPVRDYFERKPPGLDHWPAILAVLPSLRDENVELTSLPEEAKDRRTLAGIRSASRQGIAELFFDKTTGLLARTRLTQPNFLGDPVAIGENVYDEYRDVQGVRYPMKFTILDGEKPSMIVSILSIEFRDKIDDSVFDRPPTQDAERPVGEAAGSESVISSGLSGEAREKTPELWNNVLILFIAIAGISLGVVWFIVRTVKRGKRETTAR